MSHPLLTRLALAAALIAAGPPVLADTLSFSQCVVTALAQNPDLAVSQAQIGQAEAAMRQAEGNRLPKINLSLTATHTNDALNVFGLKLSERLATFGDFGVDKYNGPADASIAPHALNHPNAITNYNPRIELLVPVYNGGQVTSYVRQAKAYVRAAQAGDRIARQQLVKQVLMAFQGVHTARAYMQVAREATAAAEEYVRITEALLKQGMAVKSDVLSARVNLADVRLRMVEARNAEATALDQLHLLLGKPLSEPLDVGPPVMPVLLDGSIDTLRRQALDSNLGLQALSSQIDGAGAGVDAARAGKLPQFNIMLRQDWNSGQMAFDASSYTIAGVLTWTAFDGGTSQAAVDRAGATRTELLAKLRQARDGVAFQVGDAQRHALEAADRLAARAEALEQAREAQRLVKKRYENGLGTLIEVLSAQAQLDKAGADQVAANYELAVQRAELKRAVGVLDAETL